MPQFTRFPYVPAGEPQKLVEKLLDAFVRIPDEGEPLRDVRSRLKKSKLWRREDADDLWRFFRIVPGKTITPSEVVAALKSAENPEKRKEALAERLWTVNPLLFKTVIELLAERPYTRDDLVTYIASVAYRGDTVHRQHLMFWLQLAIGSTALKMIGIAVTTTGLGRSFGDRAKEFEVEEFLEEDEPEPDVIAAGDSAEDDEAEGEAGAAPSQAPKPAAAASPAAPQASAAPRPKSVSYSSPLGRSPQVPLASFSGDSDFAEEITSATATKISEWWAEQTPEGQTASAADFEIDSGSWLEGSEEALYRLAVAAAMVFRLGRGLADVVNAYQGLEKAGVLSDLYYGTAPASLPSGVDSQALMLASLVARRCAESPDLAITLEKQKTAQAVHEELSKALGHGLFSLELFWMMRALGEIGVVRFDDLRAVSALPTRAVRDTLFRLGFITTPYATDTQALLSAARAAGAATSADPPDVVLEGFAAAAGCEYGCANRRRCDFACRERADLET